MPKIYTIGMTCKRHMKCDLVNSTEGTRVCGAPHHYELFREDHRYDLVFKTQRPEMYIGDK